jgi:hypothetical protein
MSVVHSPVLLLSSITAATKNTKFSGGVKFAVLGRNQHYGQLQLQFPEPTKIEYSGTLGREHCIISSSQHHKILGFMSWDYPSADYLVELQFVGDDNHLSVQSSVDWIRQHVIPRPLGFLFYDERAVCAAWQPFI